MSAGVPIAIEEDTVMRQSCSQAAGMELLLRNITQSFILDAAGRHGRSQCVVVRMK
jgi:hypothetical protein